jgi:AhpC/TSA family
MTSSSAGYHATPMPPGTSPPDLGLRSTPDQNVSLVEFRGQPVILAFYPEDWSPICCDQVALYQEVLPRIPEVQRGALEDLGGWHLEPSVIREGSEPAFPLACRLRARVRWVVQYGDYESNAGDGPAALLGSRTGPRNEPAPVRLAQYTWCRT